MKEDTVMEYKELKDKATKDALDGLNLYIRAHTEDAFDSGYNLGMSISDIARQEGYKEGVEKARRVILRMYESTKTEIKTEDLTRMFGYNTVSTILENYSIDEIDRKYEEYTKQRRLEDTSIHIGDEVRYLKDIVVVTSIMSRPTGVVVNGICEADGLAITMPYTGLKKTGKHFDDVTNFLTQDDRGQKK